MLGPGDVYVPSDGSDAEGQQARWRRRRRRIRREGGGQEEGAGWLLPSVPAWLSLWWNPLAPHASLPSHVPSLHDEEERLPEVMAGRQEEEGAPQPPCAEDNKGGGYYHNCGSDLSSDNEEEEDGDEDDERHVRLPPWRRDSHASIGSLGRLAGARRRLAEEIGQRLRARSLTHASIPVTDNQRPEQSGVSGQQVERRWRRRGGGGDRRRVSSVRSSASMV